MQEAQHPNRLTVLIKEAGLTLREVAREARLPEGTLRHYAAGELVIPKNIRAVLAHVIGCDAGDLAPLYTFQGGRPTTEQNKWGLKRRMTDNIAKGSSLFKDRDGCFSFGKLKTTWRILDGDGVGVYLPH